MAALVAGVLAAPAGLAQCPLQSAVDPAGGNGKRFGASVELDGDRAAITGRFFGIGNPYNNGAILIHERSPGGEWQLGQAVQPADLTGLGGFGARIALDGDVLTAVALSNKELVGPGGTEVPGGVFVFERQGADFAQTAKIDLPGLDSFDPAVLDLAVDGDDLAFGYWSSHKLLREVRTYRRAGDAWLADTVVLAPPATGVQFIGRHIALEGSQLLVSAEDGRVLAYERVDGVGWVFDQELPTNVCTLVSDVEDLALSGNRAFVARRGPASSCSVKLTVYERSGPGAPFVLQTTLEQPDDVDNSEAWARSIDADGDELVVGSYSGFLGSGAELLGANYLYRPGPSGWELAARLSPAWPGNNITYTGLDVAVSGGTVLTARELDNTLAPGAGSVIFWSTDGSGCPTLWGHPPARSLDYVNDVPSYAPAARQDLTLDAGAARAGQLYLVLGSFTGTSPGITVDGLQVPLVFDPWTASALAAPNLPPFEATLGTLDDQGRAVAAVQLVGPLDPGLAGVVLHHAFVAIDVGVPAVTFASKAVPLALVP